MEEVCIQGGLFETRAYSSVYGTHVCIGKGAHIRRVYFETGAYLNIYNINVCIGG